MIVTQASLLAQVNYYVSTNSTIYNQGDTIRVEITAVNIGSTPDTLWLTSCDVHYYIDSYNVHGPCDLVLTPSIIPAHGSFTWGTYLFPITDTLKMGYHTVVGKVAGNLTNTISVFVNPITTVKYSVSTNKLAYQYGDSIYVTITAMDTGSVADTVYLSDCEVNYYVDNYNFLRDYGIMCGAVLIVAKILPHDSLTWGSNYMFPFPITDTMKEGKHAVVGEVLDNWISDTTWITVSAKTAVRENEMSPQRYFLDNNYPDPFNPTTIINYQLPVNSFVTLRIYDILGREVATLVNGRQNAGYYHATFNASNLSSGVYFYRLQAGTYSNTKKLLLLK